MTAAAKAPLARQRTPEWYEERQRGIGSSDAPVIAGVAPWGDIRTLFAEKVGWAAPNLENRPMRWGRALEDVIAVAYTEETGRRVRRRTRMLRHPDLPWMLASLDRVAVGDRRVVEIKTRRYADEQWGPSGSDEVPDHYRLQVLHQLAVTGYPLADLAVLFAGSELRVYTVPRDDDLLVDLISLEQAFWRAVQDRALPPDLAELGARPVPLRGGEVEATEQIAGIVGQLRPVREQFGALKQVKEDLEADLRGDLHDLTAVRGDGFRISYKPQADRTKIGWEQIATAYERRLIEMGADLGELSTLRDLFTATEPGSRPLRVTFSKETDDAPL